MTRRKGGATVFSIMQSIENFELSICSGISDFISRLGSVSMTRRKVGATDFNLMQSIENLELNICSGSSDFISRKGSKSMTRHKVGAIEVETQCISRISGIKKP